MKEYQYSGNYDDPLPAELYYQSETYQDDISLLRKMIGTAKCLSIKQPGNFLGQENLVIGMEIPEKTHD